MRVLASLLLLAALATGAAAADIDFANPRAVVEAAYAPYSSPDFDWSAYDISALQSDALNALFAKDAEEAGDEVGRIDFDPLINGQDYDITHLVIGEPQLQGTTATVPVTFENFEQPEKIDIVLVRQANGYRIDDVQSKDAEYPYSLKALLQEPMPQ